MKKLAVLLGVGLFFFIGGEVTAQEYHLELIHFDLLENTVQRGGEVNLRTAIRNPAPMGTGIHLSGDGYVDITTPWGATISKAPLPINGVQSETIRSKNWRLPVHPAAPLGMYDFHGWVTTDTDPTVEHAYDSVEVVQ